MSYETGGKFGSHQIGEFTDKCRCGATRYEVLDRIVNEFCPAAVDPKLIERIARAMCMADGNDPDEKCLGTGVELRYLLGLVRYSRVAPPDSSLVPAFAFYLAAAEAAITELEAAAMEPFPLTPGTNNSDPLPVPVKRTPWFPQLQAENGVFLTEKACRILTASEFEAQRAYLQTCRTVFDALAAQAAIDKEAVEIVVGGYSE